MIYTAVMTHPPHARRPMNAADAARPVVAIGNFDGVHVGHRHILSVARTEADARGTHLLALTFEPHPAAFFRPNSPPFRLTTPQDKAELLRSAGADSVECLPFTKQLASTPADAFVENILAENLRAAHVVVGYDFAFGKNREGERTILMRYAESGAFGVTICEAFSLTEGEAPASSGKIRDALRKGDCDAASRMLGRPMRYKGLVERGDGMAGKTLGFPTANMCLDDYVRPRYGVYAARAEVGGEYFPAVVNIGVRPTVGGMREWLEAHLLPPFSEDVYGKTIAVELLRFMRDERRFPSLDALRAAIARDVEDARRYAESM
ncbi:MAG: bifunctional riboflavin kinase/FAD synthetase [Rickettsiales bacterium]